MNLPLAAALGVVAALAWVVASIARRGDAGAAAGGALARKALVHFADQSLELSSAQEILAFAREAAVAIFGCGQVVAFEPGTGRGEWDAFVPGGEALEPVPATLRGLFGWFKHNSAISAESDLGDARLGAMRAPLRQLMNRYGIDLIMPLVDRGQVLAALGVSLGRRPTALDRELARLFRLEATAACANVRLHREAAHTISLAKEIDLAKAVEIALVPEEMEGRVGQLVWAGHFEPAGEAGSDFFSVYALSGRRAMFIIGDAIGAHIAGSMVSAVVKSCSDAVLERSPREVDPQALLGMLNRALYRQSSSGQTSCFAAMFDQIGQKVAFANAAHPVPYLLTHRDGGTKLGVLAVSGPLLGDDPNSRYAAGERSIAEGDVVLLFTDGLVRVQNRAGEPFGERRLQRLLSRLAGVDPPAIRAEILAAISRYREGEPLVDDQAFVVVRFGG